ncbi:MAG: substrate-binding domain-containing protein [Oscillospiraceae bacterium]|nr:substrate-binding domain-containing protein [Oscillospiraceae bacterium]
MRMKSLMRGAVGCMLLLSMLSATGCASERQEQNITIAVICKNKNKDEYWDSVRQACDDAQAEMKVNIMQLSPDIEDVDQQIANINEAVAAGVDAIVLAAIDPDAENEALSKANSAGIPVLTIDSDVTYDGRACYIGTQNASAAAIAARSAKEILQNDGTIGVVYHGSTSTATLRMSGFMQEINPPEDEKADKPAGAGSKPNNSHQGNPPEVPDEPGSKSAASDVNIKILESLNGEGDMEISKDMVKKLITEQHVNLVYATNQPGTRGACEAIEELIDAGTIQPDEVQLVGFDYFSGAYDYITSGILDAVIVQNPYNMGYMGVRTARSLIQGEQVQPSIDTGAVLVTADNINEEYIQFLVNPSGN